MQLRPYGSWHANATLTQRATAWSSSAWSHSLCPQTLCTTHATIFDSSVSDLVHYACHHLRFINVACVRCLKLCRDAIQEALRTV